MRLENLDNNVRTDFGSEVNEVNAVAQWRGKKSILECMIPGTGPCTVNGDCCSDYCVNHVCCLHQNTCRMEDSIDKSDPNPGRPDPVVSIVPKSDSPL